MDLSRRAVIPFTWEVPASFGVWTRGFRDGRHPRAGIRPWACAAERCGFGCGYGDPIPRWAGR